MLRGRPAAGIAAALCFGAVAIGTVAYALQLRMYTSAGPGAGLFPVIIGIGLGIVSLLWLLQLLSRPAEGESEWPRGAAAVRVGLQLAALLAFALMMKPVGYTAAAAFLVVTTALIAGERGWLGTLIVAVICSFGFGYLFALLGTTL